MKRYFYSDSHTNNRVMGPNTLEEIQQMVYQNQLSNDCLVTEEGKEIWTKLNNVHHPMHLVDKVPSQNSSLFKNLAKKHYLSLISLGFFLVFVIVYRPFQTEEDIPIPHPAADFFEDQENREKNGNPVKCPHCAYGWGHILDEESEVQNLYCLWTGKNRIDLGIKYGEFGRVLLESKHDWKQELWRTLDRKEDLEQKLAPQLYKELTDLIWNPVNQEEEEKGYGGVYRWKKIHLDVVDGNTGDLLSSANDKLGPTDIDRIVKYYDSIELKYPLAPAPSVSAQPKPEPQRSERTEQWDKVEAELMRSKINLVIGNFKSKINNALADIESKKIWKPYKLVTWKDHGLQENRIILRSEYSNGMAGLLENPRGPFFHKFTAESIQEKALAAYRNGEPIEDWKSVTKANHRNGYAQKRSMGCGQTFTYSQAIQDFHWKEPRDERKKVQSDYLVKSEGIKHLRYLWKSSAAVVEQFMREENQKSPEQKELEKLTKEVKALRKEVERGNNKPRKIFPFP